MGYFEAGDIKSQQEKLREANMKKDGREGLEEGGGGRSAFLHQVLGALAFTGVFPEVTLYP